MKDHKEFDAIIIGGSYSGLAAGMALGRALKQVLIIDSGAPCNATTPYSHNFLTQDGERPSDIAKLAKQQVQAYKTITFFNGLANKAVKTENGFTIQVASGESFHTKKLIFATGIKDIMAPIEGFQECWGISILHCPYCHGYEVRNEKTGIFGNGDDGYELAQLISNWTTDLTLFTNGTSKLTIEQSEKLKDHHIEIVEKEIKKFANVYGNLQHILFKDDTTIPIKAIYSRNPFKQHCDLIAAMGCELTEDGYVKVDAMQQTTVKGIYACGDNTTRMRSVANAVAMGTIAGASLSRQIITEEF